MGTGKLVIDLNEEPAKIKDMTTTPGGTTIEAIYQIEQSQIRPAMIRAIEEATKKSQAIREKLKYSNVPKPLRGLGLAFLIVGLMSFAFQTFLGISF